MVALSGDCRRFSSKNASISAFNFAGAPVAAANTRRGQGGEGDEGGRGGKKMAAAEHETPHMQMPGDVRFGLRSGQAVARR